MKQQNGNVLFIILIAIALFGALSIAMTETNSGATDIDDEKLMLAASEIAQTASDIKNAVDQLVAVNGCGDTQISFAFDSDADGDVDSADDYWNANAPSNGMCNVFGESGGGLTFPELNPDFLDSANSAEPLYGKYHFSGASQLRNVGTSEACGDRETSVELLIHAPYLKREVCEQIVLKTTGMDNTGDIPQDNNIFYEHRNLGHQFDGTYKDACGFELYATGDPDVFNGDISGCVEGKTLPPEGTYHFFHALIVR